MNVYRTGPAPVAFDYQTNLIECLTGPGNPGRLGPVSRFQLLLASLVERLHDGVYVLPRTVGGTTTAGDYARDVAACIEGLKKAAGELPVRDDTDPQCLLEELERVKREQVEVIREAEELRHRVRNRLIGDK